MSEPMATLKLKLPKEPVDGFEVTYFTIRHDRVQEIKLVYHVNKKWDGTKGGADFVDDWQVIVDGFFSARMTGWQTPGTLKHEYDYSTRSGAVAALCSDLERRAKQADERAREYREQTERVKEEG